jgi:predicted  nucleic acid-binding Zn-ribbon protein
MPETHFVKHVSRNVHYNDGNNSLPITVIDTPGLNEDDVQDFKHMIQIISMLHSASDSEVSACVLVVKFDSKIDAQYKATVKYYRDLLPQLFENNVIIVLTMFDSSDKAEYAREQRGIDINRIKLNTVREIMDSGKLQFKPMVFMINGLPLTDEDMNKDLRQRDAILGYISTLTPISTTRLRVAKTARIREKDNVRIAAINGEIDGYNNRLVELNRLAGHALDKIKLKHVRVGELESKLKELNNDLKEYESSDTVIAKSWPFSTDWKAFQWISEKFDVSAPYKVTNIVKWTNGHCDWKDFEKYHNGAKGTLEGNFMRGLYAELKLETTKRIKYSEESKSIRSERDHTERLLYEIREALVEVESSNVRYKDEITSLKAYIQESIKRKDMYEHVYMTVEEACKRLSEVFGESSSVCEPQYS